jgi:hypothetical protein
VTGLLNFCGRCGTKVAPYTPGSVPPDDLYVHGDEQPAAEACRCPRCGDHPSPFMGGTGRGCPGCYQLNPFILDYCVYCGGRMS